MENQNNFFQPKADPPMAGNNVPPHKSLTHWLVVAVAIIAVIGYFMASYAFSLWPFGNILPPLEPAGPVVGLDKFETPLPIPSQIPSDWKTYTNTEYGFEFKYPGDWKEPIANSGLVNITTGAAEIFGKAILVYEFGNKKSIEGTLISPYRIWIYPLSSRTEAITAIKSSQQYGAGLIKIKDSPVIVGGLPAIRYDENGLCGYPTATIFNSTYTIKIDSVCNSPATDQFDEILSTFKFSTPNPSIPINWKTFSSKYFTLSLKIPPFAEVTDTQDFIIVTKGPYVTDNLSADNGFMRLIRYTNGATQASTLAKLSGNNEAVVSAWVVDGQSFPRVDYTEPVSGARFFTIFFEKSYLSVGAPAMNADSSIDYISLGNQILSTFKFVK